MGRKIIQIIIVAAMIGAAFVAYTSFTQPMASERPQEQAELYENVPRALTGPPPRAAAADKGEALAYMEIPRFGKNWTWTTLEGTDEETLDKGPGHYPKTALPGSMGNSSFAAHRSSHGDPFLNFEQLRPGDKIRVSQSGAWWEYTIRTKPKIIDSNAGWVTEIFKPGRWLTLTTCWPKYGNEKRMFIRAEMTDHS